MRSKDFDLRIHSPAPWRHYFGYKELPVTTRGTYKLKNPKRPPTKHLNVEPPPKGSEHLYVECNCKRCGKQFWVNKKSFENCRAQGIQMGTFCSIVCKNKFNSIDRVRNKKGVIIK